MAKEEISHKGKVLEVGPEFTSVQIVSESACASCHASSLCGLSENVTKVVQVPSDPYTEYSVGEEVEVSLKASMGHKAVLLAYVLPLLILVGVLLGAGALGAGELVSALCAFASVGVYYAVLYALREKLRNEYIFVIRKMNNQL